MAIATAVQKGTMVYVYDAKGRQLSVHNGVLHGYTGGSVSVKRGTMIYTYDEKGRQISVTSAR
ncbi:MAG: hypothetical protein B7Y08_23135 [Rhodospirillales bacterium 24-66-33]|nr:MAG: hypothetical protein B7Y57_21640 [Rhodospirillales bacterium 35-66-84]OYZ92063.1 MAG: hypothetical protein B7Y08_23135 [Rhodospirillales bacterium 24-66-33]OZB23426.1 MAG: hypothetical protein B7X63_19395 [Rhodospirillales bacterium 39-66-50]